MSIAYSTASIKNTATVGKSTLSEIYYQTIQPNVEADFKTELTDCIQQLQHFLLQKTEYQPVLIRVFAKVYSTSDFLQKRNLMQQANCNFFPFSLIPQAPAAPFQVCVEASFVVSPANPVIYGCYRGTDYALVCNGKHREVWTAAAFPDKPDEMPDAERAFSTLKQLYAHLDFRLEDIVRQWNYIGNIYQRSKEQQQYYQLFNEVRKWYYTGLGVETGYPAATGIGMSQPGVAIETHAIKPGVEVSCDAISNPLQCEAFYYGQEVLVGQTGEIQKSKSAPLFERARLVHDNNRSILFVSGTAAIIGQQTVAPGNAAEQTRISIKNIERLASPENLLNRVPKLTCIPNKFAYVRVYVKQAEHIALVGSICQNYFQETPITIVQADVCRENLLVEIEAEMHS